MSGVYVYTGGQWVAVSDGGEPDPPVERTMLVGAALSNDPSYIEDYDNDCGPVRCMREYYNGLRATVQQEPWFDYNSSHNMATAFSFKLDHAQMAAGNYDSRIAAFINSWPSSMPGWLLIDNEPDQNSKGLNPATFRAAVEHVYSVFGPRPKPNLRLGIALMQYTFRPAVGESGGNEWLPDVDDLFVDIHVYGATWWTPLSESTQPFVDRMNDRGWSWGIGETNAQENPNNANTKANWMTGAADWAYDNGAEFYLPFDTGVGGSEEIRSSPQATAAMKAISVKYDAGPQ